MSRQREAQGVRAHFSPPGAVPPLPLPCVPQLEDNWCWAASAEMVLSHHGRSEAQCAIAQDWVPRQGGVVCHRCCDAVHRREECAQDAQEGPRCRKHLRGVRRVPQLYEGYGIAARASLQHPEAHLTRGAPTLLAYRNPKRGGDHMVVVVGCTSGGDVIVINPAYLKDPRDKYPPVQAGTQVEKWPMARRWRQWSLQHEAATNA